jgi:hypothetical protein
MPHLFSIRWLGNIQEVTPHEARNPRFSMIAIDLEPNDDL